MGYFKFSSNATSRNGLVKFNQESDSGIQVNLVMVKTYSEKESKNTKR